MTQHLTKSEIYLLQQVHDGEVERGEAAPLLSNHPGARVFLTALEEIDRAVHYAVEVAQAKTDFDAGKILDAAQNAASMANAPLTELAPMLERFRDGETDDIESAVVLALLEEREELVDYIAELDTIGQSVQIAGDVAHADISFDGFFDRVASEIGFEQIEKTAYQPAEHNILLQRFRDGEVSDEERGQVDQWIAAKDDDVVQTLAALDELEFSATTAMECAQEKVDFSMFWGEVQDRLDDEIESQGDNVISIGRKRREKQPVFKEYRQGIVAAIAATIMVGGFLGLFGKQIFGTNERVIEKIVIVEDIEYEEGVSVMINSPMESASAEIPDGDTETNEEEEPTVIWVLDSDEDLETDGDDENYEGQPI